VTVLPRLIPILQICGSSAVKTTAFRNQRYVGSAINSMRLFSELEVDELIVIDLTKESDKCLPSHRHFLEQLSSEASMPLAYGGSVSGVSQAVLLARMGFEKVVVGRAGLRDPSLMRDMAEVLGSQALVAAVDATVRAGVFRVWDNDKKVATDSLVEDRLESLLREPIGEVLLTLVEREGTRAGLDPALIQQGVSRTQVPLVVSGGASSMADCQRAVVLGASAVAIGELTVRPGLESGTLVHLPAGASGTTTERRT
jgi:cyclase